MKYLLTSNKSISLALLLQAGIVSADQPFIAHDVKPRPYAGDCRILEFTCATCGHITDSEQWDEQNRLISDVEACDKQHAERPVINKAPPGD